MAAALPSESRTPSRRALLAGALGGLGALAATAAGRPSALRAANGGSLILGQNNSATNNTQISDPTENGTALTCNGTGANFSTGVAGYSGNYYGVYGQSGSGYGVVGASTTGTGVYGHSDSLNGLEGLSSSSAASGVYGHNASQGYGVAARSNSPGLGVGGVFAAAALGENTADGIGVWARSQNGVGLYADAIDLNAAIALQTRGITAFSRSGKLTIPSGQSSVTKTAIRIDASSLVLAVLQQNRAGIWVRSAEPNAAGDSFTIRLNKPVPSNTQVGWFIVN